MHTHWIETLEFFQDFESSDDDEEEEMWKIQMTVSRKGLASKTKLVIKLIMNKEIA